ncbi:hypothetical protein MUP01_11385 [Candidatus Bathyarchaeota archaeon]|nr:hypothetical protein [Candidatus Bathyarchaeota archaeon]
MVSSTNGWAVGDQGTIIRWDGTHWSSASSPTTSWLNSVNMVSSGNGWAVGDSGTIIRWNGTSWDSVASPTAQFYCSVCMVNATDGWAVGNFGTIIRWSGTAGQWIPEFSTAGFILLLIMITVVQVLIFRRKWHN